MTELDNREVEQEITTKEIIKRKEVMLFINELIKDGDSRLDEIFSCEEKEKIVNKVIKSDYKKTFQNSLINFKLLNEEFLKVDNTLKGLQQMGINIKLDDYSTILLALNITDPELKHLFPKIVEEMVSHMGKKLQ